MLSRHLGAGLLVGLGAGAAATYIVLTARSREASVLRHSALKYGAPSSDNLRAFRHFVVSYDSRLRNPRWVLEHVSRERSSGDAQRKKLEFYEDAGIEPRFRSRLSDFRASGFDRGHLAPAANYKASQDAMTDTFVLSNISPQVGKGFNRDYWARFERFIKQLTSAAEDVYVLTGPLYLPQRTPQGYLMQHPMIGEPPRLVAVPTHFFKAVLAEARGPGGEQTLVGAWVLPNAAIEPDTPLAAFTVPLEALEDAAGMRMFPGYLDDARRGALDEAALAVQGAGRRELAALRGRAAPLPPPQALLEPAPAAPRLPLPGAGGAELMSAAADAAAEAGMPADVPLWAGHVRRGAQPEARAGGRPGAAQARARDAGLPMEARLRGAAHVCDRVACRLPAADWYKAARQQGAVPAQSGHPALGERKGGFAVPGSPGV